MTEIPETFKPDAVAERKISQLSKSLSMADEQIDRLRADLEDVTHALKNEITENERLRTLLSRHHGGVAGCAVCGYEPGQP